MAELPRSTAGWVVNWRREGLKAPPKQPKRGRLWLADGSCLRLRAERPEPRLVLRLRRGPYPLPAGSGQSVATRRGPDGPRREGRTYRLLNVLDEFTHECLAIRVARRLEAADVIDLLSDLFLLRGVPGHVRFDNGPEFVATAVQAWITAVGAKTAYIAPASPWENGFIESFDARLRDELLDGEIFYSLREAAIVIESWRRHYHAVRPHASLGYRAPAPEVFVPALATRMTAPPRPALPTTPAMAPRPVMH